MKRVLRILILGPLYALFLLLMLLVLPVVKFFDWLIDDPVTPHWEAYKAMYHETLGSLW